jgi:hypothetical protein
MLRNVGNLSQHCTSSQSRISRLQDYLYESNTNFKIQNCVPAIYTEGHRISGKILNNVPVTFVEHYKARLPTKLTSEKHYVLQILSAKSTTNKITGTEIHPARRKWSWLQEGKKQRPRGFGNRQLATVLQNSWRRWKDVLRCAIGFAANWH